MRCPECTEPLEMLEPIVDIWKCKKCGVWQIHSEQRLEEIEALAIKNQDMTVKELSDKFMGQKAKERFSI